MSAICDFKRKKGNRKRGCSLTSKKCGQYGVGCKHLGVIKRAKWIHISG